MRLFGNSHERHEGCGVGGFIPVSKRIRLCPYDSNFITWSFFLSVKVNRMVATLLSILASFTKMSQQKGDACPERTFIMVKPDGVQRGIVGKIMERFENRGYKLVACKMCKVRRTRV